MNKAARWRRLHQLEQADFRWSLGYGADAHRIDPRLTPQVDAPSRAYGLRDGVERLAA